MAGYNRYSMSNNACAAYNDGEMPISKWNKRNIMEAVEVINKNIDISKMTVEQMKTNLLEEASWHHTSKMYNQTNFYSIKKEIKEWTQEDVECVLDEESAKKIEIKLKKMNKDLAIELKTNGKINVNDVEIVYIDDFCESQFTIMIDGVEMLWTPQWDNIFKMIKKESCFDWSL